MSSKFREGLRTLNLNIELLKTKCSVFKFNYYVGVASVDVSFSNLFRFNEMGRNK